MPCDNIILTIGRSTLRKVSCKIIPHLAGQPEMYVREQLRAYRNGKRQNEIMTIIAKPLTDDEISDLSAWYASIEIKATVK